MVAAAFLFVTLSSIGLPGLNGFVGEVLVLAGAFLKNRTWAAIAASGMILGAVYMLWMYQRVFFGRITHAANESLADLDLREIAVVIPLAALMLWIGVYSNPVLVRIAPAMKRVAERVERARSPEGGFRVAAPARAPALPLAREER